MRSNAEEELIRDGVNVSTAFVPPNPAAGSMQAEHHILENGDSGGEIMRRASHGEDADPSEGPPAFVVVVAIQEARAAGTWERSLLDSGGGFGKLGVRCHNTILKGLDRL